jgi:ParB-like chromosome segregation protein Spo0J
MNKVKAAFLFQSVTLPLENVLPSRKLKPGIKEHARYKVIDASIREVGIIQPPIVFPEKGKSGRYILLDGHLRLEVLRDMGETEVTCLVSTDDENCTYNHRVSRIAPIQEHRMIMKAIDAGVPAERIAKALNVAVKTIRDEKTRLSNICSEAIELLKDKPVAHHALRVLQKVRPYRQVEMAELMNLSNSHSASHAKALLAATAADQLVAPPKNDARPEQITKLENEMRTIERDFVVLEDSYSTDVLNLQLARAYLKTLVANPRVAKHLGQKHPDILGQLEKVIEASSLEAA